MTLPDDVIVYPGHGAGSACGKKMSKETFDTLGNQKANNYALRADMQKDEFIKEVLTGLTAPPQYFPKNVMMNKGVNDSIDEILERGTQALTIEEFKGKAEAGALMLDVRHQSEFVQEHIPGSIFIGLDGNFAPWVGALIRDIDQDIILVVPEGREEEAVTRLSRIGYDHSNGYLQGGLAAWKAAGNETDSIETITPEGLAEKMNAEDIHVLDVRKKSEYDSEHLVGAENEPLDTINFRMNEIDTNKKYYIHCAGGYRSVIFESILKSRGVHNFVDILGGFSQIQEKTALACSEYVCPSTLL
jgi:rhodanese-related sulfurtransferase